MSEGRGKIIWQDFERGDDENDGSCPEQAVKTPRRVLELADGGGAEVLEFLLGGEGRE